MYVYAVEYRFLFVRVLKTSGTDFQAYFAVNENEFVFLTENERILCLACKEFQTTKQCTAKSRSKSCSNRFQGCPLSRPRWNLKSCS
jgi:hypothetical protein